ncbi:carotenoid biosynthesis protein [Micromonospora endolithica]|uniref:Carotenoid biosynthesis protein n=1 Tax=Micromonospora endolithica TaxID=230091 RepID=A0A3A9ZRN1_9ACTN|nr:carotenoid biosynthesis protein [Micromonospora endolithica]RKN50811.1 carotenoid biosynthesis protein [Micromonospora endolithica]TWJ20427.1 putative membrane protein [Micromonospora endolithica]
MTARRFSWALLAVLVLAQICYPLTDGTTRARLTVATVVLGYLLSVGHALLSRGPRTAAALVAVATGGGFAIEALGVATGFPFGSYDYSGQLGPKLAGVPLIIPLAWTWMAWPAWLAAVRLTGGADRAGGTDLGRTLRRIALATLGLATWDLFLDPQMVAEGHWVWRDATPALPGLPGIPVSNYLGWLLFAVLMMSALRPLAGPAVAVTDTRDDPMAALYLWTYFSSVLAHAVFLALPASAVWGAVGMSVTAVPLAVSLYRARRDGQDSPPRRNRVDVPA